MRDNRIECEKIFNVVPNWVRWLHTGIVYVDAKTFSSETWCYDCTQVYKCKFAEILMNNIK